MRRHLRGLALLVRAGVGAALLTMGACALPPPSGYDPSGGGYGSGQQAQAPQTRVDPEGLWCFHDAQGQATANVIYRSPTGIEVARYYPTPSSFRSLQQHGLDTYLDVERGHTYSFLPAGDRAVWRSGQDGSVIEMWACDME